MKAISNRGIFGWKEISTLVREIHQGQDTKGTEYLPTSTLLMETKYCHISGNNYCDNMRHFSEAKKNGKLFYASISYFPL